MTNAVDKTTKKKRDVVYFVHNDECNEADTKYNTGEEINSSNKTNHYVNKNSEYRDNKP